MKTKHNYYQQFSQNSLRLIPYLVLGVVIFSLNSVTNLNFFFKGYLVLLESQIGIVLLYLLTNKIAKSYKKKNNLNLTE